jgi:hypothetical protein
VKLPRLAVFADYVSLLRTEPRARGYLLASLVDDLGVAVSAWAGVLLKTNLLTTQRERALATTPVLLAFLLGTIVSGPLADWVEHKGAAALARYRYRLVLVGRVIETVFLGSLVIGLADGKPTLARVLPYFIVSALMKTALLPARFAFSLDLLQHERVQTDAQGRALSDERGEPLTYKVNLLSFRSLTSVLTAAAGLGGLLAGGFLQRAWGGALWVPFLVDVLTTVVFIVIVARRCRPAEGPAAAPVPFEPAAPAPSVPTPARRVGRALTTFGRSVREGLRFLAEPAQRPLLGLLAGAALLEFVTEAYNGNMILKHVLGGTDDQVRYAEITWTAVGLCAAASLPFLARRIGSLGKLFLAMMLLDGLAIVAAGASGSGGRPILGFTAAIGVDGALTTACTTLVSLALSSASSTRMRGRVEASYAFVVIVGDLFVEGLATVVSEAVGVLPMLVRAGVLQVIAVLVLAALGGRRLWRFGIFPAEGAQAAPASPASDPEPAVAGEAVSA